jgi:hypothetical protein
MIGPGIDDWHVAADDIGDEMAGGGTDAEAMTAEAGGHHLFRTNARDGRTNLTCASSQGEHDPERPPIIQQSVQIEHTRGGMAGRWLRVWQPWEPGPKAEHEVVGQSFPLLLRTADAEAPAAAFSHALVRREFPLSRPLR